MGERSTRRPGSLEGAEAYLRRALEDSGDTVNVQTSTDGLRVSNLEAVLAGTDPPSANVVVGAHYDSVEGTAGANDNDSGVAAVVELARLLRNSKPRRTIRFVLFVNEEPPYFQTTQMGSLQYARQLHASYVPVSAMISLETIGFYSDVPGSQKYPAILGLFYPSRGNFIGFVGNSESRDLVRSAVRRFRETTPFPSEGVAAPQEWAGVGWSDQWSFWQEGDAAIMITDTAVFRYPYYHLPGDTIDKIDFDRMTRVLWRESGA